MQPLGVAMLMLEMNRVLQIQFGNTCRFDDLPAVNQFFVGFVFGGC